MIGNESRHSQDWRLFQSKPSASAYAVSPGKSAVCLTTTIRGPGGSATLDKRSSAFGIDESETKRRGLGRLQTVGFKARGRGFRTFKLKSRDVGYPALLAKSGQSASDPISDVQGKCPIAENGRSATDPLRTLNGTAIYVAMDKRGLIITLGGVVLIFVLMFYSGIFMHGD